MNECYQCHSAEQKVKGLTPVADADRRTLLCRLSFDLIGLPPTPTQLAAFLADDSPQAVGTLVDELLASPHFDERWGRHWLDVARYSPIERAPTRTSSITSSSP